MKIIFQIVVVFFFLCSSGFAQTTSSFDSLKSNVNKNGFDDNSLRYILFYFENNIAKVEQEFISSLKPGFEKDFISAVNKFKLNRFSKAYELLLVHLKEKPSSLQYYEYLTKTAGILGKYKEVEKIIDNRKDEPEFIYLNGLIDYYKLNYQSAAEKFLQVVKLQNRSVDILIYLSNTYRRLGDYEKAEETLQIAFGLIEKNDFQFAELLVAKGSLFFLSGEYEKARELYEKGLSTAERTGNRTEEIKAYLNLAMINDLYGNIPEARDLFEHSFRLAEQINQSELEATVLSEWAVSFTYTNELVEARKRYEKSYELFEAFNNRERMALTANNIAGIFLNIGNYKGALDYYNSALKLAGENVRTKMISYLGLGDVYTNLSSYAEALQYYNKAKELSKKIKDVSSEAEINIGMGILFYNLGQPQKALEMLLEKYGEIEETELPYLKAELNQKMGIVYISTYDYSKAEKYLSAAVDLSDRYEDIYNSILSRTHLAYSFILNKDFAKGKKILTTQLTLSKEYELNQLAGVQSLMLAETVDGIHKLSRLLEAEGYSSSASDKNTLTEIYYKLGEYYETNEQLSKAEEYYQKSIEIIENQLPMLTNRSEMQITFFSNYHQIYNSLINIYLKQNDIENAFYYLDKSRSRNTLYNLAGIKFSQTDDVELLNEFYDANWRLNNELIDESESDSLKSNARLIERKLKKKHPFNSPSLISGSDKGELLRTDFLNNDEYFITYYTGSDFVYSFIASKGKLKIQKLQAAKDEITNIIASISPYYNKDIDAGEIHFNKDLFSFNSANAHKIYEKILAPVIDGIPKNSNLVFSLPKELVIIPFEFITTGKNSRDNPHYLDDKKFLVEDFSISYAPSFSVWKELKSRKSSRNKTALLAGDPSFNIEEGFSDIRGGREELDIYSRDEKLLPLKYSAQEIEGIEKYFSDDLILLNKDATESNFKLNSESASVIHLSTHSFLFKNYPVIVFVDDETNDGYLEMGEIARLDLKSDLVVLSSCKSGLGKVDNAEGILGMQKVLFDAGASSVVLSLWDVNDKHTSELMNFFYEFMSKGFDKPGALRQAKLKFIKEVNPNPYYWAGFVFAGKPDSIELDGDSNYYMYLLGLLFIIMTAYLLSKRNRLAS